MGWFCFFCKVLNARNCRKKRQSGAVWSVSSGNRFFCAQHRQNLQKFCLDRTTAMCKVQVLKIKWFFEATKGPPWHKDILFVDLSSVPKQISPWNISKSRYSDFFIVVRNIFLWPCSRKELDHFDLIFLSEIPSEWKECYYGRFLAAWWQAVVVTNAADSVRELLPNHDKAAPWTPCLPEWGPTQECSVCLQNCQENHPGLGTHFNHQNCHRIVGWFL